MNNNSFDIDQDTPESRSDPLEGAGSLTGSSAASTTGTPQADTPLLPVFYDESHRRWPWLQGIFFTSLALTIAGLIVLAVSVWVLPLMPHNPLPRAARAPEFGNQEPVLNRYMRHLLGQTNDKHPLTLNQRRQLGIKFARDKQRLEALNRRELERQNENRRRETSFLRQWPARFGTELNYPAGFTPFGTPIDDSGKLSNAQRPTPNTSAQPNAQRLSPVVAAFYVNWEETSWASAQHNIEHLTHFIPGWLSLKPKGADADSPDPHILPFLDARDENDRTRVTALAHRNSVPIVVLLNNFTRNKNQEEEAGIWDTAAVHTIISDPVTRIHVARKLRDWLTTNQLQGINIDFEEVSPDDRDNLTLFMHDLYTTLHPAGLLVTQDIQLESDGFDIPSLALWNDWIVPMFYDQHEASSDPGPVAGVDWTRGHLQTLCRIVPPSKIVLGVGQHGYDWIKGQQGAQSLRYQTAVISAKESYDGQEQSGQIHIAPGSLNPTFTYTDEANDGTGSGKLTHEDHIVWMQDAVSVYNQLQIARPKGIRGAALWMLGAEDPSIWSYYSRSKWQSDWRKIVANGELDNISYGGTGEVDFTAEGELLQPVAEPATGKRHLTLDPKTGLVTAETYQEIAVPGTDKHELLIPSSWIVRRYGSQTGNPHKQIVLTFDDGPSEPYTAQILDILKKYKVPAVFFVVGRQAELFPDLVRRIYDEGHEIGNHSWDHKDMAELPTEWQRLELTSTERVVQALTGRSTTLWRPPYGNDVEPTTGKEVRPLALASNMNYLTVGQKIDPQDWAPFRFKPDTQGYDYNRPKTADDIVNGVLAEKDLGSIVLLHDAGGDRTRTVAALPKLIEQLRAQGYTFVTVSQLSGIPRDKLMPPITGKDIYLVGGDRFTFEAAYLFERTLTTLFGLSIVLGVSRVFLFVGLALIQRAREKRRIYPQGYFPTVSVVIAAYNEEKVIVKTIEALLAGGYPNLEIIVVDDGSKDATSAVVQAAYGDHPLVHLIRKENGGKSSALNRGLTLATGEVMVSLDADTLFAPDTIHRLARHFADSNVGAVSGNVRVGNVHNIYTAWQALEYTTSQNFDRRGYDLLNCITVVPGAVGAMRRMAIMAVGGYTHDTLAEDTDLTWKLRRAGWRIVNDNSAMAYTEAPESLRNLAKQRFRWAFGTLQCLWKHRGAFWTNGAFGWLALPSLCIYQIAFPAISPFMDLAMVYSLFHGNFLLFAQFFFARFAIEFIAAFLAIRMDKGKMSLLPWLFLQRFVYRQLMYYVVLKAIWFALRGSAVGWNKFERTGTAQIDKKVEPKPV